MRYVLLPPFFVQITPLTPNFFIQYFKASAVPYGEVKIKASLTMHVYFSSRLRPDARIKPILRDHASRSQNKAIPLWKFARVFVIDDHDEVFDVGKVSQAIGQCTVNEGEVDDLVDCNSLQQRRIAPFSFKEMGEQAAIRRVIEVLVDPVPEVDEQDVRIEPEIELGAS